MILDFLKKKKVAPAVAPVEQKKVTETVVSNNRPFAEGLVSVKDIIAPGAIEVDWDYVRIDSRYYRTLFVSGYPRFVGMNWLSGLINFDSSLSISMYIYPTDGKEILDDLRRKIAEMEAELTTDIQRGKIVNPSTQAKLEDALTLQQDLVKGEERFFQFGLYITVSARDKDELNKITKNLESSLGALMITIKKATLEMEHGFTTTLPASNDTLQITRNMDTTSLATTFPFVSSDLSDDKGIMYGINQHNGSLVIFDRFSMPNYNSVVFATAGSGKSYLVKLEAMRSLMFDTDVIVIDPENEYHEMCEAVGGQYIAFGYGEDSKINPFDLSLVQEEGENSLNDKILGLHKLFKVMVGDMDPIEESILDRAIVDAYKMKGVTPDPETQTREPPLMEDLYKSLLGMEDEKAKVLVARFEKYIKGSFAGIFNQKTTVNLKNNFVVFGIRNLEETLRPVAMHIILDYIWTTVKKTLKRRILVVDEAWYMMQYADSAAFLRGIVKRGRKYYLAVTTITQDVSDFLNAPYGKDIVTNSSIQILLKQHSAGIDLVGQTFYLSEGEKQLLLSADKGQGIFFAGQNHVAIQVIASPEEHALITSNPEEIMKQKKKIADLKAHMVQTIPQIPNPNNSSQGGQAIPITKSVIELPIMDKSVTTATKPIVSIPVSTYAKTTSDMPAPAPESIITNNSSQGGQAIPITEEKTDTKTFEQVPKMNDIKPVAMESKPSDFDRRGIQQVEIVEKIPVVKKETLVIHDDLSAKIAILEAQSKQEMEAHEEIQQKEDEIKVAQKTKEEEDRKKLLNSLPKYQDLFKAPSGTAPKLPPLPPLPVLPPLPKINPLKATIPVAEKSLEIKKEIISEKVEIKVPSVPVNTPIEIIQKPLNPPVKVEPVIQMSAETKVQEVAIKEVENKNDSLSDLLSNTPPLPITKAQSEILPVVKAEVAKVPEVVKPKEEAKPADASTLDSKTGVALTYEDLFGGGKV